MLRLHWLATEVGGGGTGPHAANGSSIAYTLLGFKGSVSLTHSTSLFLIKGCQLCDTAKVTGSHSTSPGLGVGSAKEPAGINGGTPGSSTEGTKMPLALLIW